MNGKLLKTFSIATLALGFGLLGAVSEARPTIGGICRVKGQEENTLHGLGLVVGLNGTGDGGNFLPTIRSLAVALELMGNPIGENGAVELKDTKNVALVTVTATVPAAGARQGDKVDCVVSSIGSAKSLAGGRLFFTPLLGPVPKTERVYATAEGPITLDDPALLTNGRVHRGCRLEENFDSPFVKDGKVTLVLDENHAGFQMAHNVAEMINDYENFHHSTSVDLAQALNQVNIEVTIPDTGEYQLHPVQFVAEVLDLPILEPETSPRVVINERAGTIVIGGDVEIGAVAVTHKNVVIETGTTQGRFVAVHPSEEESPKLKALVEALNAVQVPTQDIIDIIKQIDRNGKLHAKLIVE